MPTNWTSTDLRLAAEKHEQLAARYRELADLLDETESLELVDRIRPRERRRNYRQREVYNFLKHHGPATAAEIHEYCRIPLQTVYYVCKKNKNELFIQDSEGRWAIQPRS